jgi:hypothetical protein
MNITSLWEDFDKQAQFNSIEEMLAFVKEEYNVDKDEAMEILNVSKLAISKVFDLTKLIKKKGLFKKCTDDRAYNGITSIYINGIFFGMFLSDFLRKDYSDNK